MNEYIVGGASTGNLALSLHFLLCPSSSRAWVNTMAPLSQIKGAIGVVDVMVKIRARCASGPCPMCIKDFRSDADYKHTFDVVKEALSYGAYNRKV